MSVDYAPPCIQPYRSNGKKDEEHMNGRIYAAFPPTDEEQSLILGHTPAKGEPAQATEEAITTTDVPQKQLAPAITTHFNPRHAAP